MYYKISGPLLVSGLVNVDHFEIHVYNKIQSI